MFGAFRALSHCFFLLFLVGGLGAAVARPVKAPAAVRTEPSSDWTPAEAWAWSKIEQGEEADFDKRPECRGAPAPDPKDEKNAAWRDDCRNIRARLLIDLLTQAPWREATPVAGVRIAYARIVGDIDLENTTLNRAIIIFGSRIEGAMNLRHARTDSMINVNGSLIAGDVNANSLHSESDLFFRYGSMFEKQVTLIGANVAGQVSMIGASFDDALIADSLRVGGALLMRSEGQNRTSFKKVSLDGANVTGLVDMSGASFDGALDAASLQVGNRLRMGSNGQNKTSFKKEVDLNGVKVAGDVDMSAAIFEGALNADTMKVDGDLFLRAANAGANAGIHMVFAHVDGSIDLRGANSALINLSGTSVGRDFLVGEWGRLNAWALLNLRNAHVGHMTDARDAWPEQGRLVLDGFAFDHLGAFNDSAATQPRNLDMKWWDSWAKRDPSYSPAPYAQLAAALKNAGDNDAANEIRFLGRERAREAVCQQGMSFDCFFQNVLGYTVGYGIGRYTFFALGWVVVLSLFSMFVLKWSVPEAQEERKTWLWCFGAGLSRLLPGVDLSKEFADFFDGPFRPSFSFWQGAWFYFIRFAGFVLGAAVIAAFAGLTQGP